MIEIKTLKEAITLFESIKSQAEAVEKAFIELKSNHNLYCSYCEIITSMSLNLNPNAWTDLRGELKCNKCSLTNRDRLFYKSLIFCGINDIQSGLIFERVTNLFDKLNQKFTLKGVEFAGHDYQSGEAFLKNDIELEHQNIENTSFTDCTFDYVLHCDVLEHVNNPYAAITDCLRVLKTNGTLLFSAPIYSGQIGDKTTAILDESNEVKFLGDEMYHGDPLSDKGVPVFTLFGIDLIERLNKNGFACSYLFDYSMYEGILSNNNPHYDVGHMWPIVIKIKKIEY